MALYLREPSNVEIELSELASTTFLKGPVQCLCVYILTYSYHS